MQTERNLTVIRFRLRETLNKILYFINFVIHREMLILPIREHFKFRVNPKNWYKILIVIYGQCHFSVVLAHAWIIDLFLGLSNKTPLRQSVKAHLKTENKHETKDNRFHVLFLYLVWNKKLNFRIFRRNNKISN